MRELQRSQVGTQPPNLWIKVGAIIIPVFLLIGIIEGGTRCLMWIFYGKPDFGMHWAFEYEPYLLTKVKPIPQDIPPKGERFRIVLVGGSTANQMPVEILEENFKTIVNKDIQVINLGQGGYIINQERIMLLLHGIRFHPDLLISLDGMNDIVTATKIGKPGLTYSNGFIAFAVDHPLLNVVLSVLRASQFVNSVNKLLERNYEKSAQNNVELKNETVKHIEEGLKSIAIIARGMNIPYIMVLQPYLHLRRNPPEIEKDLASNYGYRKVFMSSTMKEIHSRLEKSAFPGEVYFVDGTKAFDESRSQCFLDEVHLTDNGNEILAKYIAHTVKENGLVIQ